MDTRNGQWHGDFYEHSAVVRELSTHIIHPKHPQLLLDAPHAFYSPYALIVSLLARTIHLEAVTSLSIMGLFNLGLFFIGFRFFIFALVPHQRIETTFYLIFLTLFCWGAKPWFWSGFFHIGVLGSTLPYPSLFAMGLSFIAIGINRFRFETNKQTLLLLILLIAVIVLITHPNTFLFLATGLFSQSFSARGSILFQSILIVSVLCLAFLIAILWPYFPVLTGFFSDASAGMRDLDSKVMYKNVVSKIWPSLIGIPLVIFGMRSNKFRPLYVMLLIFTGIYIFGTISGKYSFGRVISYIVLLLHVSIAEHISALEIRVKRIHSDSWLKPFIFSLSVMVLIMLLSFKPLMRTVVYAIFKKQPIYTPYLFLSKFTGQYDVVLADIETSWIIPTFGGKVVAVGNPLAFIPDQGIRRLDLERFFNKETEHYERKQIIQKYHVDYLLINKMENLNWQELYQSFINQGRSVFESDNFLLLRLD
ncbi:hypothetical protein JXO59_06920, partial [candidate division KSB1 bacterium]|nr:hypothetical protein [candidate division KSB1 bacterium]